MVKRLVSFLSLSVICGAFTACSQQPDPSPSDTMVGGGPVGGSSSMFVPNSGPSYSDPYSDSLSDPGEGLYAQDDGFGENGMIENLLPSVYFDYDQSFIREDQRAFLMEATDYLNENPRMNLLVEGHCDYKGTTEYNIALGDRRAQSVKTFLVQLGINEQRIETLSKGDLEATEGAGDEQRQQDRRADLIVVR